mgnify:CR=1 FL=1
MFWAAVVAGMALRGLRPFDLREVMAHVHEIIFDQESQCFQRRGEQFGGEGLYLVEHDDASRGLGDPDGDAGGCGFCAQAAGVSQAR